jgi:hypothetical protein
MAFPPQNPEKDDFLRTIAETESLSASVEASAQSAVENARLMRSLASPLRQIVQSAPSDASLQSQPWAVAKQALKAYNVQAGDIFNVLGQPSTFSATSTLAHLTTTTTVIESSPWLRQAEAPAFAEFRALLARPQLTQRLRALFRRFGMHVSHPGARSPLELLEEGFLALQRPPAGDPSPGAVLLAARECIEATVATLLRRRPHHEPASGLAKISSIGRQAGLPSLPADHFERLAGQHRGLSNALSAGKQAAMSPDAVSTLFDEGMLFLIALLESLDASQLHP